MRFIRFINNFQISLEEKRSLQDKLVSSSYAVSGITVEDQDFYKVSDSLRVSDAYSPHLHPFFPMFGIILWCRFLMEAAGQDQFLFWVS